MKKNFYLLVIATTFSMNISSLAWAENKETDKKNTNNTPTKMSSGKDYDVILDVPNLSVEEIKLDVQNLKAHLSLDARVANLVQLTAGADVAIDKVALTIKGVKAQAHLRVSLDNVAKIVNKTLDTLDKHPEILESLGRTVENVGNAAGKTLDNLSQPGGVLDKTLDNVTRPGGLLTQTVNTLGQTLQRTVDVTGNIVENTLDKTGKVLNSKSLGSILDLPVIQETKNSANQIVRKVRDKTSGSLIEYTLDSAGKIINSQVISDNQQRR